jgi:very-short-patch-repair endonuclease
MPASGSPQLRQMGLSDFAYPDALLALEADSYRHHSSLSDWSRDRARNNELVALGWRILPVTFDDLRARPRMIAEQVRSSLAISDDRKIGRTWAGQSSEHHRVSPQTLR